MGLRTFKGGVHPFEGKELSKDKPVTEYLPKTDLVFPVSQHIGAPANPVVAVGDTVKRGQKIAEAGGFVSAPIFSSVSGTVKAIEYDPNRSANIALIYYADGDKRYIIAPKGLQVGQKVMSGDNATPTVGNALPLNAIPVGFTIHNIELTLGKGGQLVRSAGASAMIAGREGDYVIVRLPSSEMRKINGKCYATIGVVGNEEHMNVKLGKAGHKRWMGIRPTVRGMAMNPVDHPLGGGEGAGKGRNPVTPWGQPCKGYQTRNKRKTSSNFIVSRRKK